MASREMRAPPEGASSGETSRGGLLPRSLRFSAVAPLGPCSVQTSARRVAVARGGLLRSGAARRSAGVMAGGASDVCRARRPFEFLSADFCWSARWCARARAARAACLSARSSAAAAGSAGAGSGAAASTSSVSATAPGDSSGACARRTLDAGALGKSRTGRRPVAWRAASSVRPACGAAGRCSVVGEGRQTPDCQIGEKCRSRKSRRMSRGPPPDTHALPSGAYEMTRYSPGSSPKNRMISAAHEPGSRKSFAAQRPWPRRCRLVFLSKAASAAASAADLRTPWSNW